MREARKVSLAERGKEQERVKKELKKRAKNRVENNTLYIPSHDGQLHKKHRKNHSYSVRVELLIPHSARQTARAVLQAAREDLLGFRFDKRERLEAERSALTDRLGKLLENAAEPAIELAVMQQ